MLLCDNLAQCQPSITEVYEQQELSSLKNGRPWRAAEFRKLARKFWPKFSVENCGP